jgi:hypothetical protein
VSLECIECTFLWCTAQLCLSASTPSLPLQSVMPVWLWHEGDLYDDWSAAGHAMSDNAELRAIADGICQAYNVGLEDVHQVHAFSNSANTLCLTMDTSHHSGQHLSLSICKLLVPWLQHHPNNSVHFHHITVVWSWRTTNLHTSLPHQLTLR